MNALRTLAVLAVVAAIALAAILWWRGSSLAPDSLAGGGGTASVPAAPVDPAAAAPLPADPESRRAVPALDPSAPVFTIVGHVLADARRPIAGGEVVAHAGTPGERSGFMTMMDGSAGGRTSPLTAVGPALARAAIGADGSFRLATNTPDVRLHLEHDFYALALPEVVHVPLDASAADVVLAPYLGGCIRGRLLGPHAARIQSVRMATRPDPMGVLSDPKGFVGSIARAALPPQPPATDGTFTFRAIVPGAVVMLLAIGDEATGRTSQPPLEPGELREVALPLQAALQLPVRVLDDTGAPIAGAKLAAVPADVPAQDTMTREIGAVRSSTGTDGSALLKGLGPGTWRVRARADGCVSDATEVGLPVERELTITLHRGASIRGIVVDTAGAPIADARVASTPTMEVPMLGDMSAQMGPDLLEQMAAAGVTTDQDGRFELTGLDADDERTVIAAHAGHAAGVARGVRSGDADLRIALLPSCSVAVRVVGAADGQPIPAFTLQLRATMFALFERPLRTEQISATDGRGELRGLAPGDYTLAATAPGHSETTVQVTLGATAAPDQPPVVHELRLSAAARVTGRVVDPAGKGIGGALVQRSRGGVRDNPVVAMMMGGEGTVRCDEQGRFAIGDLPPGRMQLAADADGFAGGKSERIEIAAGQVLQDLEIVLDHGGSIEGLVRTVHGEAADEFTLIVQSEITQRTRPCRAAADGRFRADNLEPGRYVVQAMHPAALRLMAQSGDVDPGRTFDWKGMVSRVTEGTVSQRCVVRAGETTAVELDASDLGSGTRVTLTVTVGGSPLAAGIVEAVLLEDGRQRVGILADGEATFGALRPGRLRVQVRTGMTLTPVGEPQFVLVPIGIDHHRRSIELPGGELAGRVVDENGRPLPSTLVRLVRATGGDDDLHGTAITDNSGAFAFRGLPAGSYGLVTADALTQRSTAAAASRIDGLELADGERRTDIELRAQPAVGITVTVLGADGGPLTGAMLLAVDVDGRPLGNFAVAVSGHDGRAHLGGLPRGRVRVVGRAPGNAPGITGTFDALPGQSLEATLQLQRGTRAVLEARARDGTGLTGATIQARCDGGPWLPSLLLVENDGADGRFDLGRLGSGDWEFRVTHPATGEFTVRRAIADGPAATILAMPAQ